MSTTVNPILLAILIAASAGSLCGADGGTPPPPGPTLLPPSGGVSFGAGPAEGPPVFGGIVVRSTITIQKPIIQQGGVSVASKDLNDLLLEHARLFGRYEDLRAAAEHVAGTDHAGAPGRPPAPAVPSGALPANPSAPLPLHSTPGPATRPSGQSEPPGTPSARQILPSSLAPDPSVESLDQIRAEVLTLTPKLIALRQRIRAVGGGILLPSLRRFDPATTGIRQPDVDWAIEERLMGAGK